MIHTSVFYPILSFRIILTQNTNNIVHWKLRNIEKRKRNMFLPRPLLMIAWWNTNKHCASRKLPRV